MIRRKYKNFVTVVLFCNFTNKIDEMLIRNLLGFLLLLICTSCSYFSDPNIKKQQYDDIIDFSKVDISPSFAICDRFIDDEKTRCFRTNIHQQLTANLVKGHLKSKTIVNEVFYVYLLIDSYGDVNLDTIEASKEIKKSIPNLHKLIEKSIYKLPSLKPGIKRGIPVTTRFQLPIHITTK